MKMLRALLVVASLSIAGDAYAGSTYAVNQVQGVASLPAGGTWPSACLPVIPPYAIHVATDEPASASVRRYVDKECKYALDLDTPLPAVQIIKRAACFAGTACGVLTPPDSVPFMALRITIKDISKAANRIEAVLLVQDPPAPPPKRPAVYGETFDPPER